MTLPAGTRLGPYEILSLIGVGGMGQVYRARDTRLLREVAIKVLPPDGLRRTASSWMRFEQEARSASALNHPSVVTIHDVGQFRLGLLHRHGAGRGDVRCARGAGWGAPAERQAIDLVTGGRRARRRP